MMKNVKCGELNMWGIKDVNAILSMQMFKIIQQNRNANVVIKLPKIV